MSSPAQLAALCFAAPPTLFRMPCLLSFGCLEDMNAYFAATCVPTRVADTKLLTCDISGREDCAPLPVDFSSAA